MRASDRRSKFIKDALIAACDDLQRFSLKATTAGVAQQLQ